MGSNGFQPELGSLRPAVEAVRDMAESAYQDRGSVILTSDELVAIQNNHGLSIHQAKGALAVGQGMARESLGLNAASDLLRRIIDG